jgi:phosphoribosylglycinamide formyltransferase-1
MAVKKRIAIMISGRGSNMEAIARSVRSGVLKDLCEVAVVISNRRDAPGLKSARDLGLKAVYLGTPDKGNKDFEAAAAEVIENYKADLIVLAGFMKILQAGFVKKFKNRIVNIHPADPAAYKGPKGYKWAFENGLKKTFITIHFVDEGVDTGKIIAMREVDLQGAETIEEVKKLGLAAEHEFYSEVLAGIIKVKDKI